MKNKSHAMCFKLSDMRSHDMLTRDAVINLVLLTGSPVHHPVYTTSVFTFFFFGSAAFRKVILHSGFS